MNDLRRIFDEEIDLESTKWEHYFDIYDRHFRRFVGAQPRLLEIGVFAGGSLQMWQRYFGEGATIVGMDTNPYSANARDEGFEIFIGEQGNKDHLQQIIDRHGAFDSIIDDGSHSTDDLKASFEKLFPHMSEGGVYLVEDTHTNYWEHFGGGYKKPGTFTESMKHAIDQLNAFHSKDPDTFRPNYLTYAVNGLHFYDSVIVIEKGTRDQAPKEVRVNAPDRPRAR